jgi:hypothetical protein
MTWAIFTLTLRQLVRQRRTVLLLLLAAIPAAVAILFRFSDTSARTTRPSSQP